MKKMFFVLVLSILLVFVVGTSAFATMMLKAGMDLAGTNTLKALGVSLENDTNIGISISGEYLTEMGDNLKIGGGIEYQMKRKNEGAQKGFNYIPIYGVAQYYVSDNTYILGKIGYNVYSIEDANKYENVKVTGGLYCGFGGGFFLSDNMVLEASYSFHNGKIDEGGLECESEYSKLGISVGFVF